MISNEIYLFKKEALIWMEKIWELIVVHDLPSQAQSYPPVIFLTAVIEPKNIEKFNKSFYDYLPTLKLILEKDAQFFLESDPAAKSIEEIVLTYPGFYAIAVYRIANFIHQHHIPLFSRILTEHVHSITGIDIHPGAAIEVPFFIDHGTGVVIGETTQIGKNVKIYQGVTLGALAVHKKLASIKRHPTVEDDVVLYAGSCVLGGDTVIGKGSIIGGNAWITSSIPSRYRVVNQSNVEMIDTINSKQIINFSI